MSALPDEGVAVFHCIVCGPVLRLLCEDGHVTVHQAVPHPDTMTFDEEDNPQ